ncbi:MAG: hypothetical protein HYW27_02315 [Candidatus Aenigmarchaeota archaeon]|nr:hypothetical protein [Candidatus Aenigmarchaeota archaeon]
MATLSIEAYSPDGRWTKIGSIGPADLPGSLSDNRPDGGRDVYVFKCLGPLSVIYRSDAGMDIETGSLREIAASGSEVVKELRSGSEPYEMRVKTDKSPEPRQIRFVHV